MFAAALSGASVRELEKMARRKAPSAVRTGIAAVKNTFYSEVELALKEELGRKVYIKPKGKNRGTITVEFYSDKELSEIAKALSGDKR